MFTALRYTAVRWLGLLRGLQNQAPSRTDQGHFACSTIFLLLELIFPFSFLYRSVQNYYTVFNLMWKPTGSEYKITSPTLLIFCGAWEASWIPQRGSPWIVRGWWLGELPMTWWGHVVLWRLPFHSLYLGKPRVLMVILWRWLILLKITGLPHHITLYPHHIPRTIPTIFYYTSILARLMALRLPHCYLEVKFQLQVDIYII